MLPALPNDALFCKKDCRESTLPSDSVELSIVEARAEGMKGGSFGVFEAAQVGALSPNDTPFRRFSST